MVDFNRKEIEIAIDDMISMLESESSYNRHLNVLESDFESSTILFIGPNHLSLPHKSRFFVVHKKVHIWLTTADAVPCYHPRTTKKMHT